MTKTNDTPCPCGSGQAYATCCEPFITGSHTAPSAEALMRSRYTAYTQLNDDYLLQTWHPDTRPGESPCEDDGTVWTGLEILRTENGTENDNEGIVEFIATANTNGLPSQLHEISHFVRNDGVWSYVDGKGQEPVRRTHAKIGRNDPCPCGSGKKYKKCCGG